MPCTLIVYDAIVLEEVLARRCREQVHEVAISALKRKCPSNEPIDEDIGRREDLRTREVS